VSTRRENPNYAQFVSAVTKLEPLLDQIAFVGGCVIGLLIMEDIVAVHDGRPEVVDEVRQSALQLRRYLSDEFVSLLATPDFLDALPGYLMPDAASQQRLGIVLNRVRSLVLEG